MACRCCDKDQAEIFDAFVEDCFNALDDLDPARTQRMARFRHVCRERWDRMSTRDKEEFHKQQVNLNDPGEQANVGNEGRSENAKIDNNADQLVEEENSSDMPPVQKGKAHDAAPSKTKGKNQDKAATDKGKKMPPKKGAKSTKEVQEDNKKVLEDPQDVEKKPKKVTKKKNAPSKESSEKESDKAEEAVGNEKENNSHDVVEPKVQEGPKDVKKKPKKAANKKPEVEKNDLEEASDKAEVAVGNGVDGSSHDVVELKVNEGQKGGEKKPKKATKKKTAPAKESPEKESDKPEDTVGQEIKGDPVAVVEQKAQEKKPRKPKKKANSVDEDTAVIQEGAETNEIGEADNAAAAASTQPKRGKRVSKKSAK